MIENLGGRKFIFSFLLTILAFVLVMAGLIGTEEWVVLVKFLLATYVAGNVVTKFALKE